MSLKQKEKTLEVWIKEICHENWCYACPISKHHNCDNLRLIRLEDAQKEIDKLKLWVFALYKQTDHLGHEDERQSCAYLLRDYFGVETEKGMFGELFLTDKSQKELERLRNEEKEAKNESR
jgi:hypothetical protein